MLVRYTGYQGYLRSLSEYLLDELWNACEEIFSVDTGCAFRP